MTILWELAADVRARGLTRVFATRGREIVGAADVAEPILGRDLAELIRADPDLRQFAGEAEPVVPVDVHGPPTAHPDLARRVRDLLERDGRDHPDLREADGSPVRCIADAGFENWGRTVRNAPALTFVPRTKQGVCDIVRWAAAHGRTVRAAGYRHTWSDLYSADGQVLVSLLPLRDVEQLPSREPPVDPTDELQGIEIVGTVAEDAVTKALCRIGAATTNEQFRRWCLDEQGGNWAWTVPLNVIMVEISWGGSNAPICHGAGRRHQTLSDLVTEVEFVNARGEIQVVSDPELLKAAAGCFGLLGVVTALTLKLDPMSYATLQPRKLPLALAVPPPPGFTVPAAVDMEEITQVDLDAASERFVSECEDFYYAEWFWFPYQQESWVNCWQNDGDRDRARPYPGDWGTLVEQLEEYLAELATHTIFRRLPGRVQAELFGALAMANLPSDETVVTPVIEALHFRRGIQNLRVLDMELEIPVPARADDPTRPDWSVCQRAWWDAARTVLERDDAPMRVALEMRIMGGSAVTMAPQHGNSLATCSIEVLTTLITPADSWTTFMQDVADLWTSYRDADGSPLNVRPHWAKQWQELQFRGQPAIDHLRDVAYAERIPEFRAALQAIAAQGGYTASDLRRFTNPLLDELFGAVFV